MVYEFQQAALEAALGNFSKSRLMLLAVLDRLQRPTRLLREDARRQLQNGLMVMLGGMDCFREHGIAQAAARELSQASVAGSRQAAAGVSAMYHALRGERAQFERCRREVDVLAAQSGDSWRHDVVWARNLWLTYALCEDVIGLKQCLRELEVLTQSAPSLGASRDAAAALYLAFRGQAAEALRRHRESLERASRDINELSLRFVVTLARLERLTGDAAAAEHRCAAALAALQPAQFEFQLATQPAQLERILALLDLGREQEAGEQCELLLTAAGAQTNPLLRGLAHKARAAIALAAGNAERFAEQLQEMRSWFGQCDNPSLVAQCAALAQLGAAKLGLDRAAAAGGEAAPIAPELHAVRALFARCRGSSERVQTALDVIVSHSRAQRGYLFLVEPSGDLRFAAPSVGVEPPEELAKELSERLAAASLAAQTQTQHAVQPEPLNTLVREDPDEAPLGSTPAPCEAVFLLLHMSGHIIGVGAVALVSADAALIEVSAAVLHEVARALYDSADVRTVYFDTSTEATRVR